MARMIVIYQTPDDVEEFEKHYFETHVPLAKTLPGLRRYEVSRGPIVTPVGEPAYHRVATLHFDDMAAIRNAFASAEGIATAADRRLMAPNDDKIIMLLFEADDV